MRRTLAELVDDWFLNSPSWPVETVEIDVAEEADAFLRDEIGEPRWTRDEVVAAMRAFKESHTIVS